MSEPEQWRPVIGHAAYEVSDLGRLRSVPRDVLCGGKYLRRLKGQMMRPWIGEGGYEKAVLRYNDGYATKQLHRLVLEAFVGPCPDGMEGCHNNGNPSNNAVSNLRWDTHASNQRDQTKHGTNPHASKTHCPAGHLYDEANTYLSKRGRHCRTCNAAAARRYKQRVTS